MASQATAYSHENKATKLEEKPSKSNSEEKQPKFVTVKINADKEETKRYSGNKATK